MKITKAEVKVNPETFQPVIAFEGYLTMELAKENAMTEEEATINLGKNLTEQIQKLLNAK